MDALKEIEEKGYYVIEDVIDPLECDEYVKRCEELFDVYSPKYVSNKKTEHGLNHHSQEKIIYNIHNKDKDFLRFLNEKKVLDVVKPVLSAGSYTDKYPIVLNQNTARSPLPGRGHQQLHNDSNFPASRYALMVIAVFALEDMTMENGTTRLVPGSHKYEGFPEEGKKYEDEIQLPLKKGSVLVYDASIWHGGSMNTTENSRWSILMTYNRWFVKPVFDFINNTPKSIYDSATREQREILGFTSVPPLDEFTRLSGRTEEPILPRSEYNLPN